MNPSIRGKAVDRRSKPGRITLPLRGGGAAPEATPTVSTSTLRERQRADGRVFACQLAAHAEGRARIGVTIGDASPDEDLVKLGWFSGVPVLEVQCGQSGGFGRHTGRRHHRRA